MKQYIKKFLLRYPRIYDVLLWIYKHTWWRYKQYKANKDFQTSANEVFAKLLLVMQELDLIWWIEYGTLLGAIRENDFLSHDVDIDIGMLHDTYNSDIEKVFIKYGFKKQRAFFVDDGLFAREETYIYKGVGVDIFYFKVVQDKLIGYGFKAKDGLSSAHTIKKYGGLMVREITFPYSGFKEYRFKNFKVNIPNDSDSHLSAFYGNWREKNTNWNPYTMAKNVVYLNNKVATYHEY
jgi:hypothetical protein